jgi:mono/diheme cytochrome c family protein
MTFKKGMPILHRADRAALAPAPKVSLERFHRAKPARLLFIFAVIIGSISAPATAYAQSEAARLFEQHCVKCHGADGAGKPARPIEPSIPDFTAAAWHTKRSDKKLQESILDGKGETMPSYRKKLSDEQVRALVAHVRAFAPIKKKANPQEANEPASDDFELQFRSLQEQLEVLKKEFRQLSQASIDATPSSVASKSVALDKAVEAKSRTTVGAAPPPAVRDSREEGRGATKPLAPRLSSHAPRPSPLGIKLTQGDLLFKRARVLPCKPLSYMRCIDV